MAQAEGGGRGGIHRKPKVRRKPKPYDPGKRHAAEAKAPARQPPPVRPKRPDTAGNVRTSGTVRKQRREKRKREHEYRDVKTDADRRRAETFKRTPKYGEALGTAAAAGLKHRATRKGLEVHDGVVVKRKRRKFLPDVFTPVNIESGKTLSLEKRRDIAMKHPRLSGESEAIKAPVLKALEQTTRPIHATAGATRAAIRGENVPKAAARGIRNKDKVLFSDVLKELGAPKAVQSVGGFALDVATDPLTYVTGGIGTVAKTGARKVAQKAAKVEPTPLRAPTTPKEARRTEAREAGGGAAAPTLAERAEQRALREGDQRRGLVVRLAGKEAPGVRKATAKAVAPLRKAEATKPAQKVKRAAEEVRPTITPAGVGREEFREVRRATRTARAKATRGTFAAGQKAAAFKEAIGKKNYSTVIDAIESGTTRQLPEHLRGPAKRLQDQFKYARRLQRRSGVRVAERKGYVPHTLTAQAAEEAGFTASGVGRRVIRPSSSKQRLEEQPLAELREQKPGKYSENLPELYARRMDEATTSAARADLNRRMADIGRTVKKDKPVALRGGEAVFRVRGSDLQKVTDKAELRRLADKGPQNGRYVVLNERLAEQAVGGVRPQLKGELAKKYDAVTGWWKFLATVPNLGFHARNLAGDTQNAFLAESAGKLARNIITASRGLGRLHKQEAALRMLGKKVEPTKATVPLKGGERANLDDLVREAEKTGGIRTGFIARELPELQTAGRAGARVPKIGKGRLGRLLQSREDLLRLATYIGGRKRGLSSEKAAERSTRYHFDYGDLTDFERNVARRVAPFYTFSARNIPLQFQSFFTKPGKYAQYEKIREEFGKAFDAAPGFEGDLAEYEQRAAPIPIKWKGKKFTLSMGPSGLPLTDLNELPISANPAKAAEEWMSKATSMLNPALKAPIEMFANVSFFYRDKLERETGPYVPAPSFVSTLPVRLRKSLKIVPDYVDKRTGKKQWGWPAKLDYVVSVLFPGPFGALERMSTPSERPGQGVEQKLTSYLTGVRTRPIDPVSTKLMRTYDERQKVQKKLASWRQRGVDADRPNPEYRRLLAKQRTLTRDIEKLKVKRGDKPTVRRPGAEGIRWTDSSTGVKWTR